ncbi:MAG TPA: exodeoxyribonuclease III [Acidimicrobiales bacterium]|nr:exodeoxyribonuclease III [Acidimicrobiales bacterium]
MRIATWNVNSLTPERLERLWDWVDAAQPDILCLQETKSTDDAFPALDLHARGYASVHNGQGRWNGVAIASRVGLADPVAGFAAGIPPDPEARLVSATCGGVRVSSVYVPNGRAVGHDQFAYKLDWLARLRAHLDAEAAAAAAAAPAAGAASAANGRTHGSRGHRSVAVCGDFNIAPADIDVYSPAAFAGSTHVTPEERAALAELEAWGLRDAFRELYPGVPRLYSWWDYRAGMFHKHNGMRIDLVLLSDDLASQARFALVDRNARKGKKPSDHAPLFVDLDVDVRADADAA